METALIILAIQTLFGALDNVLNHELTERLPSRPSARYELTLHAAREAIYGALFLILAWTEPHGILAAGVLALLLIEITITIADFIEEDRSRRLPPFERILHTILAVMFGAFLLSIAPWLLTQTAKPSGMALVSHGLLSWFFTLAAVGVIAFAIRNATAVRQLAKLTPPARTDVPPSGRSILVTGATGFIGTALVERLIARGDRVFVLTRDARQAHALFGDHAHYAETFEALPSETRIDAVVNLAGAPIIGLPWFRSRRRDIWRSRVDLTDRLVQWLATLDRKPEVLISGSAIGFFGDRGDDLLDEAQATGSGFAAELCAGWESAARRAEELGVRVMRLRIGLVLDAAGGPLPMMALPTYFGFGATLGSGSQWLSWITRNDLVRMILTAIDDIRWQGAINGVAPEPVRQADFQRALARTLHRPSFLKAPSWTLRTLLGEMSSIFLNSQRVVPAKAGTLGFAFDVVWAADAIELAFGPAPSALPERPPLEEPQLELVADAKDEPKSARPRPATVTRRAS